MRILETFLVVHLALIDCVCHAAEASSTPGALAPVACSLVELISTPERFEGKNVQVQGYGIIERERFMLYLSETDATYMDNRSGVALGALRSGGDIEVAYRHLSGKRVTVEGFFVSHAESSAGGKIFRISRIDRTPIYSCAAIRKLSMEAEQSSDASEIDFLKASSARLLCDERDKKPESAVSAPSLNPNVPLNVSLAELSAHAADFDGRKLQIVGYARTWRSRVSVFWSKEAGDKGEPRTCVSFSTPQKSDLDKRFVLVVGTFKALAPEKSFDCFGEFSDVAGAGPWPPK